MQCLVGVLCCSLWHDDFGGCCGGFYYVNAS